MAKFQFRIKSIPISFFQEFEFDFNFELIASLK